ncbi:flavin reductase family protein [Kribbella sp. NPDC051718]|uniref:flavin reductase family protein n=1 Tax=Kribbella sp. NPDC051718 TaxID=3155168 RepID=UPI0034471604
MTHLTIEPSILYVGTPVELISTDNGDGTFNLAPMSSAWALGDVVVLGIGTDGQTAHNLRRRPEMVINFPSPELWTAVESIAGMTGRYPVPEEKRERFRYEPAKFESAGLTPVPSELVGPPRVAECPLQFEAVADDIRLDASSNFFIVEARVLRVHADQRIVIPGTSYVDPRRWSPLIYNFRHYFGLAQQLGESFRTETPTAASCNSVSGGGWAELVHA